MLLAATTALLLVGLCTVPHHVPVRPSVSLSYAFGYSNRAALVLIAAWMAALALLSPGVATDTAVVQGKPLARSTLTKALLITFAGSLMLHLAMRTLNGFGESIYLIDRIRHTLAGQRPYADFEFAYGAGLLYGPWLLCKVFRLSPSDAYGVFFVVVSVSGVALMYQTLQWLDEPLARKRSIFLLSWVGALLALLSTGVNYSLFRFVLPCTLGVLLFRQLSASRARGIGARMLLVLPYTMILLLVSPELALAFAAGATAMAAWMSWLRGDRRDALWAFAVVIGLAVIIVCAWKLGVFVTLVAFARGGYNFPIVLSVFLLLLLTRLAIAALYAGSAVQAARPTSLLMLIAVSAASLPAALGRCDPGHMREVPLGMTLASLVVASRCRGVWRFYLPASVLSLLLQVPATVQSRVTLLGKAVLPTLLAGEPVNETTALDRFVLKRMSAQLGPDKAAEKFADVKMLAHLDSNTNVARTFSLGPNEVAAVPFGFAPTRFGIDLAPGTDPGYFSGVLNVVTPQQVDAKIAELRVHPERPLLLLRHAEDGCAFNDEDDRAAIRSLFLTPVLSHERAVTNPLEPLCAYIRDRYRVNEPATPEHFGYALWRAK